MAAERAIAAALLLGACASSSIRSDLARVRELSHLTTTLAAVADVDVDPETARDARELLREPLDADTAVRVALLNNRELRARLRELGVARGELMQAGLVANPIVEVELLPERNSAVEVRVEYDVTSLVLAPLRADAAAADLDAARLEAAGAVVQLGYDVRTAFHAVQAAGQRLAIGQRMLDAFAASRDAAVALVEAGNIKPLDAAAQVAAHERARITVALIELEAAEQRERLQRLLGLFGDDTSWSVRADLAPVPDELPAPARTETRALEASLDLAVLRSRAEASARRAGLARAQGWLPDISIDVHALHGDPEPVAGEPDDTRWRFGAGVSLTVPLFDRQQGTARARDAELDAVRERYQGLAVDLRSLARDARNRVVSAHARARQFQRVIVPAQRNVLEQTLLQYNAMQVGVLALLQARRDELDVELAYVDTLRDYWNAVTALDALLAGRRVMPAGTATVAPPIAGAASQGGH